MTASPNKIIVVVEEELVDLAPSYLERRRTESPKLLDLLGKSESDYKSRPASLETPESPFTELRRIAHQLSGNAGSYGFPVLSDYGAELEEMVRQKDFAAARKQIEKILDYIARVELQLPQS